MIRTAAPRRSHRSSLAAIAALASGLLFAAEPAAAQGLAQGAARGQAGAALRAFPLLPAGIDADTGLPALAPEPGLLAAMAGLERVLLQGLELDGARADLELRRIDLERFGFGFQVDGEPAPGLLEGLDLSVWRGTVAGEPGSDALIGLSSRGSFGWIQSRGEIVHLLGRPGASGDWGAHRVVLGTEAELAARGLANGPLCTGARPVPGTAGPAAPGAIAPPPAGAAPGSGPGDGDCSAWTCPIAVETDFQLFEIFGDVGAQTAYLATLLAAISDRYEEQIDTVLTFPYVQLYTTAADPWVTPDVGGSTGQLLDEFSAAWAGNIPAGAKLGHIVSGAALGGGIAYLEVLCETSETFSFAVSANLDGGTPFPIAAGPLNWDFMVFAHETGHNFGSPHTHDFSPPIDDCANGACITNGTIMSYCHLCDGGLSNITTFFAPECVDLMVDHAGDCLPLLAPLVAQAAQQPSLVAPFHATPLVVDAPGTPLGGVTLQYRFSPGASFASLPMAELGGGQWGAELPAAQCGELPEWFFSMVDAGCGFVSTPSFSAEVGNATTLLHDDLEASSGWTVGAAGDDATSGVWVRGDPIGTGAQPENDVTVLGTDCFFTGQGPPGGGLGDNDVDGGKTTLTTPAIDLSSGDARIGYWRWYSNDTGAGPNADVFEVEISNGGAWVDVETVGPAGEGTSGGWIYHELTVSDFVAPSADVRLRFIASDEGEGSLVEAAVDELRVFRVSCAEVCQADLGFGGPGTATLTVCGGELATGASATLALAGATPGATAHLWAGIVASPTPTKGGMFLPVPPLVHMLAPLDGSGAVSFSVPGGGGIVSFFVQATYPLPSAPFGWGFSNAVRVDLLP